MFHKLTEKEIDRIIELMLAETKKRLQAEGIEIEFDTSIKELIAKKGTDTTYGARPLRRAIQSYLEDKLAEEILDGNLKAGIKAEVSAKDEKIVVEAKS